MPLHHLSQPAGPPYGWGPGPLSKRQQLHSCLPSRSIRLQVACDAQEQAEESGSSRYRGSDFVRQPLISPYKRTTACRRCTGSGAISCPQCAGTGRLARGGYHKRNPVNAARVVGSKWTAMERTFGWRHFRVLQKRGQGKGTFVLMAATCDESTQFWLNIQNLKDRERWASGWLQKQEILALEQQRMESDAGPAAVGGGTPCKACGASGSLPCPLCSLAGQVVDV